MTEPRFDGPYELPVDRIDRGRSDRRRGAVAAVAILAVLGTAIGLARLSDTSGNARPTPRAGVAKASAAASELASPAASPARPAVERVEHLVDAADIALPGAPDVAVVAQPSAGSGDLRVQRWTPGAGLRTVRTFKGAAASGDQFFAFSAPTDDHLFLLDLTLGTDGNGDHGRLVGVDGSTLWEADDLIGSSGVLWSDDGRRLVVAAQPRHWDLLSIDRLGRATAKLVKLPGEVFLPSPIPVGSINLPDVEPRTIPLGFSGDGRWVYGSVVSPDLGLIVGSFRVAVDGSRVERTMDFRVGRPDGLVPRPGTIGTRVVDPASGDTASWRISSDTTSGPRTLEIRAPDSSFRYAVDAIVTLGAEWAADGRLYAVTANSPIYPSHTELVSVAGDGTAGPPILTTGAVTVTSLIGLRNGYAALLIYVTRPTPAEQLVMVELADPTHVTALTWPSQTEGLIGASLDR